MDELLQSMGERLMRRRKQLRLTQEELAERADMTTQTISTAETGRKALRPHNIVKLCRTLEISADYLLFGEISGGREGEDVYGRGMRYLWKKYGTKSVPMHRRESVQGLL